MDKLNVGVIGCGTMAQIVHIPNLSKSENVHLVAISDLDHTRAKLLAEKYKIQHAFKNHQELLALPEIDAVIIASPTNTHKEIAIDALHANKSCFVEKPLARSATEAKEILDVLNKTKGKLMVGMNQRFRSDALVLKSFIQHGEIGDVFFIKSGWLQKNSVDREWKSRKNISGGGVFIDLGIMVLDLSLWLLDFPEPKSVSASHYSRSLESQQAHVEDFSSVLIRLKNGKSITVDTSWNFETDTDMLYCNVYGNNGFARIHPLTFHKKINDKLANVTPERVGKLENIYHRSYQNQLKHFIDATMGLYPMASTCKEAYERMLIVEAIYKSAKLKKEVVL